MIFTNKDFASDIDDNIKKPWEDLMQLLFDKYGITDVIFDERLSTKTRNIKRAEFGMDILLGENTGKKIRSDEINKINNK